MAANASNVPRLDSSATNISTTVYATLVAATPINTSKIIIVNKTSSIIALAIGAASSEVQLAAVIGGGMIEVYIGLNVLPIGSRLSLIALDTTASSGLVAVSLLP